MARRLTPAEIAWEEHPINKALLGFLFVVYAMITLLFTSYTNNLDEIKPTLQFMLLPMGYVGLFYALYRGYLAPIPRKVWIPLAALLAVFLISGLLARYRWRAWFSIGWHWSVAVPFFIIAGCIKTPQSFRRFVNLYVGFALLVILFGLFHYLGGFSLLMKMFFPFGNPRLSDRRLYDLVNTFYVTHEMFGTILNHSFYAAYLLMVYPLAINLFMAPVRSWWEPVLGLVTTILAGISIILSDSKTAEGALFLISCFYLAAAVWAGHVIAKRRDILWAAGIGFGLLVATIVVLYWAHFASQIDRAALSLSGRHILWDAGWKMFLYQPDWRHFNLHSIILGVGPGGYLLWYPSFGLPDYYENAIANVNLYSHNLYLDFLCEEGVLGFAAFMAFLGAVLYLGFRQIKRPGSHFLRTHQVGLTAAVLGVSIQNYFCPNARWTVCGVNLSMLLGMAVSCAMLGMREHDMGWVRDEDLEPVNGALPKEGAAAETGAEEEAKPAAKRAAPLCDPVWPVWNRRIGMAGLIVSALGAAISFGFSIKYWNSAYYNNEGIVLLDNATYQSMVEKNERKAEEYYRAAIANFDESIKWWPGFLTAYYKKAHALSQVHELDKALEAYDRLAQYAPDYSEIHRNYGIIYQLLAMYTKDAKERDACLLKAVKADERAAQIADKIQIQRDLAKAYKSAAASCLSVAPAQRKEWQEKSTATLNKAAMRLQKLEDDKQLQVELRRELADSLWTMAHQMKGKDDKLYRQYLEWDRDVIEKLMKENGVKDEKYVSTLVKALRELGKGEESDAFLRKEIAANPVSVLYRNVLAQQLTDTGKHGEASLEYERLFRLADTLKKAKPVENLSKKYKYMDQPGQQAAPERYLLSAAVEAGKAGDKARTAGLREQLLAYAPQSPEAALLKNLPTVPVKQ